MLLPLSRRGRAVLVGALGAAALSPSVAHADPIGVGQFPAAAGCTYDEQLADKAVIYNNLNGNRIGAVRLMYSRRCQTWWSRLVNDDGRASRNAVTALTPVTTVPFQGFSDRQDSPGIVGAQDTRMVPAVAQSQYPGGPVATIGQAQAALLRGSGELAGSGVTRVCLPPTASYSCPAPY